MPRSDDRHRARDAATRASEQSALLLIEHTEEQDDGRFHFIGRRGLAGGDGTERLLDVRGLAAEVLLSPSLGVGRRVQVDAVELGAGHSLGTQQGQQGLLDLDVELGGQRGGQVAHVRAFDEAFHGVDQRADLGEPGVGVTPKPTRVELRHAAQRVEGATMRVARQVRDLAQLPEDGHVDGGSERLLHLAHRCNLSLLEQARQRLHLEGSGPHKVRSIPQVPSEGVLLTF